MTQQKTTPYSAQQNQHFWKTGVAQVHLGKDLFTSLHKISLSDENCAISSVGSCFAQHVGKWLLKNNYRFLRSKLDTKQISSFAFGNIYTPRCFLQWLTLNNHDSHQFDIYYCPETKKYFDLLRPNITPEGFTSRENLILARQAAKDELIATLAATNVLIFTLGLTEAWQDVDDVFYPSCPGVIAGSFDPQIFALHEFTYDEIKADLLNIKTHLKQINPNINILLTVSPVPLTATATNKHILVASQYSKSVLRAVAGYLCDQDDDIHYFPSYEIITVNNNQDFRFNDNRRTVSNDAVEYVMKHFSSAFGNTPAHSAMAATDEVKDNTEVECDDERLEALRKLAKPSNNHIKTKITLVGDSHMSKLTTAFDTLKIPYTGGMIMNGSGFAQKKFALCESEYFVPFENAESRQLWAPALANILAHEQDNFAQKSIIISNIGLQTHQTASRFVDWIQGLEQARRENISLQEFVDFFNTDQVDQLSILIKLKEKGHQVIVVSDPPFCRYFEESRPMANIIYAYGDALACVCAKYDIPFVNAPRIFDEEITEPMLYASNVRFQGGQHDWIHGNERYYLWLTKKLLAIIAKT